MPVSFEFRGVVSFFRKKPWADISSNHGFFRHPPKGHRVLGFDSTMAFRSSRAGKRGPARECHRVFRSRPTSRQARMTTTGCKKLAPTLLRRPRSDPWTEQRRGIASNHADRWPTFPQDVPKLTRLPQSARKLGECGADWPHGIAIRRRSGENGILSMRDGGEERRHIGRRTQVTQEGGPVRQVPGRMAGACHPDMPKAPRPCRF